jgi:hypothetical protein
MTVAHKHSIPRTIKKCRKFSRDKPLLIPSTLSMSKSPQEMILDMRPRGGPERLTVPGPDMSWLVVATEMAGSGSLNWRWHTCSLFILRIKRMIDYKYESITYTWNIQWKCLTSPCQNTGGKPLGVYITQSTNPNQWTIDWMMTPSDFPILSQSDTISLVHDCNKDEAMSGPTDSDSNKTSPNSREIRARNWSTTPKK